VLCLVQPLGKVEPKFCTTFLKSGVAQNIQPSEKVGVKIQKIKI
jgi:hypothetical protein